MLASVSVCVCVVREKDLCPQWKSKLPSPIYHSEIPVWYPHPVFPPTLIYEQNPLGTSTFVLVNARSFGDIQLGALLSGVAITKGCLSMKLRLKRIAVRTCYSLCRADASWEDPGLDSLAPHPLCRDSTSVKEACAPLSWTVQWN